jgi:hypothetical protein
MQAGTWRLRSGKVGNKVITSVKKIWQWWLGGKHYFVLETLCRGAWKEIFDSRFPRVEQNFNFLRGNKYLITSPVSLNVLPLFKEAIKFCTFSDKTLCFLL